MEEKIMFNVLKAIDRGESGAAQAPDNQYIKSLEVIGLIKDGWDTTLTTFGRSMLNHLQNKFY